MKFHFTDDGRVKYPIETIIKNLYMPFGTDALRCVCEVLETTLLKQRLLYCR